MKTRAAKLIEKRKKERGITLDLIDVVQRGLAQQKRQRVGERDGDAMIIDQDDIEMGGIGGSEDRGEEDSGDMDEIDDMFFVPGDADMDDMFGGDDFGLGDEAEESVTPPPRKRGKQSAGPSQRQQQLQQQRRADEILQDPEGMIEFVLGETRYRLIPVGTIKPVRKEIVQGPRGRYFYWKKWDRHGRPLPPSQHTRVYLKQYQIDQCLSGSSDRTVGLAGWTGGVCKNQPKNGRMRAARPPKRRN